MYSSIEQKTTRRIRTAVTSMTTFIRSFIAVMFGYIQKKKKKRKKNLIIFSSCSSSYFIAFISITSPSLLNCQLHQVWLSLETDIYNQQCIQLFSGNLNLIGKQSEQDSFFYLFFFSKQTSSLFLAYFRLASMRISMITEGDSRLYLPCTKRKTSTRTDYLKP